MGELVVRAALGGVLVCAFSLLGEVFKPKTFSGLFGAAPSVALVSLALAYHSHGARYVRLESESMVLGALAFCAYGAVCAAWMRRQHLPVWLSAGAAWGAWLAVALSAWRISEAAGILP